MVLLGSAKVCGGSVFRKVLELSASKVVSRAKWKLREANYFLSELVSLQTSFEKGNRPRQETFSFNLSAFLNAGQSVIWTLEAESIHKARKEGRPRPKASYKDWYVAWKSQLKEEELRLWEFMEEQRGQEVHAFGASGNWVIDYVPVTDIQRGGMEGLFWFGPPGTPPPMLGRPILYFEQQGAQAKAVDTCRKYFQLLEKHVSDFES